ncbi:MAG: glycosyltransferase [Ignavibacteriales bacterium]|nr:glycosyltransferase [Ignavibacteriales bacterium]
MGNSPLVTVNILTYNRREDLRNTLQKVSSQNYKNIETVVVDNASTDGTAEMIRGEFPFVKYIGLEKNIGIAGWNEGFKSAKGEYIFVLDDDSYPTDDCIQKGIEKFWANNKLAVAGFQIFNTFLKEFEISKPVHNPKFFIGCGALIKKEIFSDVGYYNSNIFVYYHEHDFTARCYSKYYDVVILEDAVVIHNQSVKSRGDDKNFNPFVSGYRYYHHFISYSIFLLQRFYFRHCLFYFLKWIMNRLIICVRFGYYKIFVKALFYLLVNSIHIIKKREVLNNETQKFYRYGSEALVDRTYFPNFKKPKFF